MENSVIVEKNDFSRDLKNLKKLTTMGIMSIVLPVIGLISFIVSIFIASSSIEDSTNDELAIIGILAVLIPIILASAGGLINFIGSIMILAISWNSRKVSDSKILWGLLAMFLLGSIAILIFAGIGKSAIRSENY